MKLTPQVINSMLLQQDVEFRSDIAPIGGLLYAAVTDTPEEDLLAAGLNQIRSEDPRRRILGIRLIRELRQHQEEAARELGHLLRREAERAVVGWLASAFGFLPSDGVM